MSYRLLEARSHVQSLSMSPVFIETLQRANARLEAISAQLSTLHPASKVSDGKAALGILSERINSARRRFFDSKSRSLNLSMAKLDALSPLAVLGRGYAIAENENGGILRDSTQVTVDDLVNIRLEKGSLTTKVTGIERGDS
jgi:exodeoxyribonuclease VII large subunit